MMDKFGKIRCSYPVLETQTYLDTPSTGLISRESYEEIIKFLNVRYTNGGGFEWYIENWARTDQLRGTIAQMINARADEIFFDKNCSSILNIISSGLDFQSGSNVVTTDLAFPGTAYTWMNQARRGLELRRVKSERGMVPYELLIDAIDDKTIAVSLCMVEFSSGFKHDVLRIGKYCRERDILLIIDASQCIGALEINVDKMNIDFLAVSSYKWLNNLLGIGFGYINRNLIGKIDQKYMGWVGTPDRMDYSRTKLEYNKGAQRYELGGLNWIGLRGLETAIKIYLDLGKKEVEEYILGLTEYIYKKVEETPEIGIMGPYPKENRSGISFITFPKSWRLNDKILYENKIRAHVSGENLIRVGVHFYNNKEDIDRLFEFLKNYSK